MNSVAHAVSQRPSPVDNKERTGLLAEARTLPTMSDSSYVPQSFAAGAPHVLEHGLNAMKLEEILDASSECIVCVDRQWRFTYLNQVARDLLQAEDLIGQVLWTRYPANRLEPFASHYRRAMDERVTTEFEAFAPTISRWMKIRAQPFDEGIALFSTDISKRKRAEDVRDASEFQLQQVLDATTDAVVSFDYHFNYSFLNRQAELLLGRDDLAGKNIWREFPATEADPFLRRTMDERVACELEVYNPPPLDRWFRIQTRPSEEGIVVFFRDVTAERAARKHLLDQQETLAFVQQTARVATWEIDLDTRLMRVSEGSFPVWGLPCAEIQTVDQFLAMVHPDDLAEVRTNSLAALADGKPHTVDYRTTALDGSLLWLEGRAQALYDITGRPTHLRGMTTDITSRRQNEENLRASEERYRVLGDLNPQALWVGAPDGSITYANRRYLDYIGKTTDDITGLDWLTAFDPADRDRVVSAWGHSIETGDEYAIEARMIRALDGCSRWWSLRALPVRDSNGVIQQWLGVSNEIHDSKVVAESLIEKQQETERQRAEIETVYRTAPIGLALFDPLEFRFLKLNDRQAQIVGLPIEQIIGCRVTDLAPIPGLREMFEQVAAGHSIQDYLLEGELATQPGEHRYWNVNYFPVYGADGTVQAISAASLEITRQKKSELALIQSEKLAAVGRLASSISHEINNPLEAITNLLYILGMEPGLPASVHGYVQTAQSELARVSQIATQTLRFHRQAVDRTWVSASELVTSVLNLYQGRLSNSGITVHATYASQTPVFCYENDIRQVLNNLIANAIDAMRNGGRLIVRAHNTSLAAHDHEGAQLAVRITIADTGHGMSPGTQARIFEPFYTTKDLNGTGLGLWISSGIVANHQGQLTVRSCQNALHHGTVFTLRLPVSQL